MLFSLDFELVIEQRIQLLMFIDMCLFRPQPVDTSLYHPVSETRLRHSRQRCSDSQRLLNLPKILANFYHFKNWSFGKYGQISLEQNYLSAFQKVSATASHFIRTVILSFSTYNTTFEFYSARVCQFLHNFTQRFHYSTSTHDGLLHLSS